MAYSGTSRSMMPLHSYARSQGSAGDLARALGWLSIGIGVVELVAPKTIARSLGARGQEVMVGAYGVREIITGRAFCCRRTRLLGCGRGLRETRSILRRWRGTLMTTILAGTA